jgi:hypothetical protein
MNDREIYEALGAMVQNLMDLSEEADTLVGETALRTAAATLAGTAKAIHDHALSGGEH